MPADHQHADRAIGRGAGAARDDQRRHAGHQRDGGHEDGAEAVAVGLDDGVVARHALGAQTVGVIDLENRVLLHDAEEQQQSEAREDIHGLMRDQQRENAERDGERQGDENGDGVDEGFELRGEHDVHEDEGEGEGQDEIVAGARQFLGGAGEAGVVVRAPCPMSVRCLIHAR